MYRAKSVDEYIKNQQQWEDALKILRKLLLDAGLEEGVKWGGPVYMLDNKNILSMGGFKSFVSIWFYQGALLKDEKGLLVNAQEGVTQAQRQMRFASVDHIDLKVVNAYVQEAIKNHRSGLEIKANLKKPLIVPAELEAAFKDNDGLQDAFEAFTLSKKREFAEYIINAKRIETKMNRLEKMIPLILRGEGLSDRYRS